MGAFLKLQVDFLCGYLFILLLYFQPTLGDALLWHALTGAGVALLGYICRLLLDDDLGAGTGILCSYPVILLAVALAWAAATTPYPLSFADFAGYLIGVAVGWLLPAADPAAWLQE